jgi:hypothetical protein
MFASFKRAPFSGITADCVHFRRFTPHLTASTGGVLLSLFTVFHIFFTNLPKHPVRTVTMRFS